MPRKKAVVLDGKIYPSLSQASRELGIPRGTLASRLKSQSDNVTAKKEAAPIYLAGRRYSTVSEAARTLGIPRATLESRLQAGWPDDKIVTMTSFQHTGKPVTVFGRTFAQTQLMLEHYGIEQTRYNEYLRLGLSPEEAVEVYLHKKSA